MNPTRFNFLNAWDFFGAVQRQLPNPDPVLRKRGGGISIYRELLADPHLEATFRSRKAPVMAAEWILDREDAPARVFRVLEKWLKRMDIRRLMGPLMDLTFWGYMPVEIAWGFRDGLWLPDAIIPKPPEWFTYYVGSTGEPELRFLSRTAGIDGEPMPDEYTCICPAIDASYENPYGRGFASVCFWPIIFKKAGLEFWLNFAERFASPWVKGTMEEGATRQDVEAFRDDLDGLINNASIALSGRKNVELLSDAGTSGRAEVFERLCMYQDSQISKAVLGQTLSTEVQDKGALATARVHGGVRDDIVDADLKTAAWTLQDVIRLVMKRNGWDPDRSPTIRAYEESDPRTDLAVRDERISPALTASGLRFTPAYFKKSYGLEEDDLEATPNAPDAEDGNAPTDEQNPPGSTNATGPGPTPAFALPTPENAFEGIMAEQESVSELADLAAELAAPDLEKIVADVLEAIHGAESYEDVVDRAALAFPAEPMRGFADRLIRGMFGARVAEESR